VRATITTPEAEPLLDRLDAVVKSAKKVWLTDQVRLDKEPLYEVLDQLRGLVAAGL
jgi:hypothetical protein